MKVTDRHRRRRLLYLVGLVPAVLLLMVSGRIAVLLHQQGKALAAYAAGDHERAQEHFENNRWLNPVERWVAPFGEGDARFRLGDFDGAVGAFEASLAVVPGDHECVVRVNLALAHEELGDTLLDDDRPQALESWQDGRDVVRRCKDLALDDDRETDDESLEVAVEVDARLARKLGVDERARTRTPEEAPPEDEETREKRRRLEERNRKALEDNVEHKDEFDTEPPPPPTPQPSPTPQW